MISVDSMSLRYPSGKGVFDVSFHVPEGSAVGYLGPNGAGKSTTIRALMGFMPPTAGACSIGGMHCFQDRQKIQGTLGYIPGEISFLEGMRGDEYLSFMAAMRGMKNFHRMNELLELFEFSPKGPIKRYSKGMKQKLGIVAAFMHNPKVAILDEPTSGLDPLMQNRFIDLILSEKKKGTTLLMSSHLFEEVERTCDQVLIIKEGRLIAQSDVERLKSSQRMGYTLQTPDVSLAVKRLREAGFETGLVDRHSLEVFVVGNGLDRFISILSTLHLTGLSASSQSLENIFMHYYAKGGQPQ